MEGKTETVGKDVRKVIPVGGSLAITLPSEYVKTHNIKSGDRIELEYNEVFLGKPVKTEDLHQKLSKIGKYREEA